MLSEIDRDIVSDSVNKILSELSKLEKFTFKNDINGLKITQDLLQKVNEFSPYLPLIYHLKNPGLRDRHWDLIQ